MPLRRWLSAVLLLISLVLAPGRALAADPEDGGFQQKVDDAAGVVVNGLGSLLFYPLFQKKATAEAERISYTPAAIAPLVDELEEHGIEPTEATMVLTVPAGDLTEAQAEALQVELQKRYTPTSPKGIAAITVQRDEEAKSVSLAATSGGVAIIAVWLALGALFLTFRMGFINLRAFRHAIDVVRGRFDNPDDEGEVSHFQALASALSATVGLGNIAGVALAVTLGGPGAVFWMILAGFFGMSSKFVECTLGQKYREIRNGRVMGGPMFYLRKGFENRNLKPLGVVLSGMFAVLCIGGSLGGGNTFQVNQSLGVLAEQFPVVGEYRWVYGLVMVAGVGAVIIGGIRRIAATAEKIVPAMCGLYVLACLWILLTNAGAVPEAFGKILGEAFTPEAGYGGFAGVMIMGIRRSAFSNEAGVGSAAIAHSAAKTDHPVREGVVALLEPFIDTIVVCTMTGLVIVITGAYSAPENFDLISTANGAALTSRAMGEEISWFPYVLLVAVVLFAYSTMISWSYYGERCWAFLFGDSEASSIAYKILFLVFVFLGSVVTATNILNFGDLMILSMAVPNLVGLYVMSGEVRADLKEYMGDLKAGRFKEYK